MTRRRLLRAGRRAFSRRGLAGANLRDDILRPARVSVGSFYHQFADKTELLLEILREHAERAEASRQALRGGSPARDFTRLAERSYRTFLTLAEADPALWRIQSRERWSHDPRVRRFLAAERRRWQDWLCEEQRRLPGRARAKAQRERLAGYLLGLATDRADARSERSGRAARTELGPLVRFSAAGVAGLARRPVATRQVGGDGGAAAPATPAQVEG